MRYILIGAAALAVAVMLHKYPLWGLYFDPKLPVVEDGYFGSGARRPDVVTIKPFHIEISDLALDDLYVRLNRSRVAKPLESAKFHYGTNGRYLEKLLRYWLHSYNWRKAESSLNAVPQFVTEIEGLRIHFIRQRPPEGKYNVVYPLLLVHGWPSSFYEFLKVIPLLTDPVKDQAAARSSIAFEVIVPSIPGYAWSEAAKKIGLGTLATARIFAKLMERLDIKKYFCQGGDWGAVITSTMAQLYPDRVIGLHLNTVPLLPYLYPIIWLRAAVSLLLPFTYSAPQNYITAHKLSKRFKLLFSESGYLHIQATKPDTIGAALVDSPIGLAAYMLEKYSTWTRLINRKYTEGGLELDFSTDELITQIMIYWLTGSGASSVRFYKEFFDNPDHMTLLKAPVLTPTAVAYFRHDPVLWFPRSWIEAKYKSVLQYSNDAPGGHFPAWEQPKLFSEDLFKFVYTVHDQIVNAKPT